MLARSWASALAATLAFAGGAALLLVRFGPDPSADVARGSEEAFVYGAHPRELTRDGPVRWTPGEARYVFLGVADGPAQLEVAIRGALAPVTVVADGLIVGLLEPRPLGLRREVQVRDGRAEIRLLAEGRLSGSRRLGVMLERVTLRPARASIPLRAWWLLLLPALVTLWGGWRSGARPWVAAVLACATAATAALALWPFGLLFSPYARVLSVALSLGLLAAGAFAAWLARRIPGSGAWALGALLIALAVQGVAATSPLMVVSDAVFHANKLQGVAAGHLFPTSVTQHARPFTIPYGVSFYALLAPFSRLGLDGVWLVRVGAALSGVLASAALFALLRASPARAALAVVALQLVPITFDMYSYGNFSNVFAQALTVAFFAWWASGAPRRFVLGGLLFACGCLAHLSGAIVLAVLAVALAWARRADLRADRTRLLALAAGALLTALYYAHFAGLVLGQLSRLHEGAGSGAHGLGLWEGLRLQAAWTWIRWGAPALVLALAGWPRVRASWLNRDLASFWLSGVALFVVAVATPLEVRYLYALTLPLAVAMADGALALARRGPAGWAATAVLAGWQAWLAWQGLVEGVLLRYRV